VILFLLVDTLNEKDLGGILLEKMKKTLPIDFL